MNKFEKPKNGSDDVSELQKREDALFSLGDLKEEISKDIKETLINTSTTKNIIFLSTRNFFLYHLRHCRFNKKKISCK